MISVMSSVGRPTDVSTITMVTSPAWGMPAAPTLAAVAVMLQTGRESGIQEERKNRKLEEDQTGKSILNSQANTKRKTLQHLTFDVKLNFKS